MPRRSLADATLDGDSVLDGTRAAEIIRKLTFREANRRFHIGYRKWKAVIDGKLDAWRPCRGSHEIDDEVFATIVDSVKVSPHWSTPTRASNLGIRTETVQRVLKSQNLNRSIARLRFAGFEVEDVAPLRAARLRRILALAPGCYTSTDFKSFGVVRGGSAQAQRWIRGCLCVDQFTGFATVRLSSNEDAALACRTLTEHVATVKAAFGQTVEGVVLSDNGLAFDSAEWHALLDSLGLRPRWTRPNQPWSNGKAEALNKTLKYECFPAICSGVFSCLEDIETALIVWLVHYNEKRYHRGWINRGLPPAQLWRLWQSTKGKPLERIARMHLIKVEDMPHVRWMGLDRDCKTVIRETGKPVGLPFALIIDNNPDPISFFRPLTSERGDVARSRKIDREKFQELFTRRAKVTLQK